MGHVKWKGMEAAKDGQRRGGMQSRSRAFAYQIFHVKEKKLPRGMAEVWRNGGLQSDDLIISDNKSDCRIRLSDNRKKSSDN